MKLIISHTTEYGFETGPSYGLQQIRLTPKSSMGQTVETWTIDYEGADLQTSFKDHNNNHVELIRIHPGAASVKIHTSGVVTVADTQGVLAKEGSLAPHWYYLRQTPLTTAGTQVKRLSEAFKDDQGTLLEKLHALSRQIIGSVAYETGRTTAGSSAEDAIKLGAGVCQDHAHIFIAAARAANIPARYVSGYLMMNDRVVQDATHAWAEAFVPDLGWTGFDVSNGIAPDSRYVRVATGLDYSAASPISGIMLGGIGETIDVDVRVAQQ